MNAGNKCWVYHDGDWIEGVIHTVARHHSDNKPDEDRYFVDIGARMLYVPRYYLSNKKRSRPPVKPLDDDKI